MIEIGDNIAIEERELDFFFVKSSGPGGQSVNKVATAVQLRFDVRHSPSLPEPIRDRLALLAGNRMTDHGILVIDARRYRSQVRNREDAVQRLVSLISRALEVSKPRVRTKPTFAVRERRLKEKRHRGEIKKQRRSVQPDDTGV